MTQTASRQDPRKPPHRYVVLSGQTWGEIFVGRCKIRTFLGQNFGRCRFHNPDICEVPEKVYSPIRIPMMTSLLSNMCNMRFGTSTCIKRIKHRHAMLWLIYRYFACKLFRKYFEFSLSSQSDAIQKVVSASKTSTADHDY